MNLAAMLRALIRNPLSLHIAFTAFLMGTALQLPAEYKFLNAGGL